MTEIGGVHSVWPLELVVEMTTGTYRATLFEVVKNSNPPRSDTMCRSSIRAP